MRNLPQQQACPLGGDTEGAPPAQGAPPAPTAPAQSSFSDLQRRRGEVSIYPRLPSNHSNDVLFIRHKNTCMRTQSQQKLIKICCHCAIFFFSYPHADCQSHYKPHHHGRHWWSNSTFISIHSLADAHLPFLILPLFLSFSLCVGTDRRCEHRRGCSWWCRLSSRPHTGTSNPPVQTVPPPVF